MKGKSNPKEVVFTAVITRADGTVEDLGQIAYYNRNPFKRLWNTIKQLFKNKCQ